MIAACRQIYKKHYGIDSTVVEALLKPESWVPTPVSMILTFFLAYTNCPEQNILSDHMGPFGFNIFIALVVDLLHEFELGVWHMLLVHLLRILTSLNKDSVHELDKDCRAFVCQLTQIKCHQARLHCIKQLKQQQALHVDPEMVSDPQVHHHIGQSKKLFDEFGQYLRKHTGDPTVKVNNCCDFFSHSEMSLRTFSLN